MKRVLFVVNIPSPYRVDFFNELGKECNLTVAFEGTKASNRNSKWVGEKAKNFKAIYFDGVRVRSEAFLSFQVLKVLNQDWDFIFLGGYSTPTLMLAIESLKMKKKPFILEVDGGFVAADSRIKYLTKRHLISAASAWMSTGEKTTDFLVHYGAERSKCYFYPFSSIKEGDILLSEVKELGGFREERERIRKESKKKIGFQREKLILAVGQIIPRKGYDILLQGANLLGDESEIIIVGGNATKQLLTILDANHLQNVRFIDFLSKSELAEYYKAADLFVHPTREDIWGLVINEALAFGLPIITTDRCLAGLELIRDGFNGKIVEAENSQALAEAINQVLAWEPGETGFHAVDTARKYTIEAMAKKHMEYINT